jgi:parvulin-like peptidyl-prolyl isomerase
MLAVLRKNQQILMLVIAVLTIIAFIWLYNPTDKFHKFGRNDVFEIYGRTVQRAEVDREARAYGLALGLGLTDFVKDMGGLGGDEQVSLSDFILNVAVMRHEAPLLGIGVTDEQVAAVIKGLTLFQTGGAFDPAKYAAFLQEQLAPKGFTQRQLEEIVRDSVRTAALHRVITSPVAVGEAQVRDAARIYQPVTAQMLRFEGDAFAKTAEVKPGDVSAFYERNKQGLVSPETRDISYVSFELPEAARKLEGKERASALQKLADQAEAAGKAIRDEIAKGSDFAKSAAKSSLRAGKASAVERDGTTGKGKDAGLPESVVSGAFRLQKNGEVSDLIQDGDTFYLVTVDGSSPARQLALAEVTERITEILKRQKASQAAAESASKSLEQIRSAMASGKSFADAAKAAGVKTQIVGPLTPSESKLTSEQQAVVSSTLGLKVGELGQLQPAPWGAFAVWLQKRDPLTDAQWKEHRETLSRTILGNEQEVLFRDWLRAARGASQLRILGGENRRGGA